MGINWFTLMMVLKYDVPLLTSRTNDCRSSTGASFRRPKMSELDRLAQSTCRPWELDPLLLLASMLLMGTMPAVESLATDNASSRQESERRGKHQHSCSLHSRSEYIKNKICGYLRTQVFKNCKELLRKVVAIREKRFLLLLKSS